LGASVFVACAPLLQAQSWGLSYTVTNLTTGGSSLGTGVTAIGLNSNDQVVGYFYKHVGSTFTQTPFVYTPTASTPYQAISGFTGGAQATGINNAGVVVGSDSATGDGFIYSGSTLTEVSPLAGSSLTFSGINNNGVVVGTSSTSTSGVTRAVTYNSSSHSLTDVGSGFSGSASDGYSNAGYAINDLGQVASIGVATGGTTSPLNSNAVAQLFVANPSTPGSYTYNNVGNTVDSTDGTSYSTSALGIDSAGNLAFSATTPGNGVPSAYLFNTGTSSATVISGVGSANAVANVNGSPEAVGVYFALVLSGGAYVHESLPYAYQNGVITNLQNYDPLNITINNAIGINSKGDILAVGTSGTGATDYLLLTVNNTQLVYTGAVSNSWDTTSANFSPTTYSDGQPVLFDDTATGSTTVYIPSTVSPGSVTFNNSSKAYVITGASGAGIGGGGSTALNLTGHGSVTLETVNSYAGATNVAAGTLIIAPGASVASTSVVVAAGASLNLQNGTGLTASQTTPPSLQLSVGGTLQLQNYGSGAQAVFGTYAISIAGSSNSWTGKLDLANNDLIAYRGSLSQITNLVKSGYAGGTWQGNGITSSAAASDTTHLTALGVIQNTPDGTTNGIALYSNFHGTAVYNNYVLAGYTYYGDANLDGQVDSSDYTLIDGAYLNNQNSSSPQLTGWYNGDFNYDGVINGSDYTLIDNAFNAQGLNLGGGTSDAEIAQVTAQISGPASTSAVPEPATLGLLGVAFFGTLRRRPRARRLVSDGQPVASTEC
jgi:hypothetical protein